MHLTKIGLPDGLDSSFTLLADIQVWNRECIPWKVPRTIRVRGIHVHLKDKDLIDWQDAIRMEASRVYHDEPYEGPVMVVATFWKGISNRELWNTPWFARNRRLRGGDQTNYWKAAEDAIANRTARRKAGMPKLTKSQAASVTYPGVIANDSQVVISFLRKMWGPASGVELRIFAVADGYTSS